MAADGENPLIKALPPATDYMTYLTILEFNLTKEQLPVLHDLLQDERLTTNIGWDLVHLLLPHLPDSEQCLQDVACLGNPREVVLKVTELLEELGTKATSLNEDNDSDDSEADQEYGEEEDSSRSASKRTQKFATLCAQFQTLMHMLCVLHPRIKTKFPSRFLETSIQAILPAYTALAQFPAATRSVLMFVRELSGSKRPTLPPRGTEETVPTVKSAGVGTDPEAGDAPDSTDAQTQKQLLSALMTHVARSCLESFPPAGGGSGLAWVERYNEKRVPSKIVPRRQTMRDLFASDDEYNGRDALVSQLLNIATGDLRMNIPSLIDTILSSTPAPEADSTSTIPLSPTGTLYLLASAAATSLLNTTKPPFRLPLLPSHAHLLTRFIGSPNTSSLTLPSASMHPAALIDAMLILGWLCLSTDGLRTNADTSADTSTDAAAEPETDEAFNTYLQALTLIAATHPSPSLRNQANDFAGAVLGSHSSEKARLAFLKDTLEFCPYESIKASAVGWIKGEMMWAVGKEGRVFGKGETLWELAPLLFPTVGEEVGVEEVLVNVPFWLAGLNFLYLLCGSGELREGLGVERVVREGDVKGRFVGPMRRAVEGLKGGLGEGGNEGQQGLLMDVMLLDDGVARAQSGLKQLNI